MAKKNVAAAPAPPPVEYASAMDKIRDEMAKSKDNYVQVVGEYLTGYLLDHPEAEAALVDNGKSIQGSLEVVRKEAQKVKVGNMAVLDDRTVFGIVLGYFGIKSEPDVIKTGEDVLKTPGNVHKTGENVPAAAGATSSVRASADTFPSRGRLLEADAKPTPADPFDLDALLGVI
jgi:hypothetical protein